RSPLPRTGAELHRCALECVSQKCGVRRRYPSGPLRASPALWSRVTDHPTPIFYRQGRTTTETTEVRTTIERPRDANAEGIQPQGRRRWHRDQDRQDERDDPYTETSRGSAYAEPRLVSVYGSSLSSCRS